MTRDEHLMTIAGEECAELAQRFSKALRFGPDEVLQPGQPLTNRQRILQEFADLVAVMQMLGFRVESGSLQPWVDAKREKVTHFLAYSQQCGTLTGGDSPSRVGDTPSLHHPACDPGWGPANYRCHPDCPVRQHGGDHEHKHCCCHTHGEGSYRCLQCPAHGMTPPGDQ